MPSTAATALLAAAHRLVTAPRPGERDDPGELDEPALPSPRPLRVVPPRQRTPRQARRRRRLVVAGSGLLLALSLFALVSVHVLLSQGQFTLQRLQTRANDQDAAYQRLRLKVADLEAPQHIVAEAEKRGMIQPPVVTYLAPTPDSSAVGTGPASAEPVDPGGATSWSTVKPHLVGRP